MSLSIVSQSDGQITLHSPTAMPKASGFLWNRKMMIQMNCRGYAVSQFMQPEPAKYSTGPALEAKTFMQPEHPYYAHHPGRFFYLKDQLTGELISLPYEPVRKPLDEFEFVLEQDKIRWQICHRGLQIDLTLSLLENQVAEVWSIKIRNLTDKARVLSLYPYFSFGYQSWMNQSADFDEELNGIIADKVSPYQKVEDYPKQANYNELSFLIADRSPDSWCASQQAFEGEGGLVNPDAVQTEFLSQQAAIYETPLAALQYNFALSPYQSDKLQFLFGAAKDREQILGLKTELFDKLELRSGLAEYSNYLAQGKSVIQIETPDEWLNEFTNHWLPRQMFYHGDSNRLTTDPQTRNFLQDSMGMCYLSPDYFRRNFLIALEQQFMSGEMPDGILIHPDAELKYINQVPHADHCVWLPICLTAYLNETADLALLEEPIGFADSEQKVAVFEHVNKAMHWLDGNLDHRGLSLIAQGDWCDPMNMVGHKGKGVSSWLTMASSYAYQQWADVCQQVNQLEKAQYWRQRANELNAAVNEFFWDGQWYARGITDEGRTFGTSKDKQGRIFLNPQSWSLLSRAADAEKTRVLLEQVNQKLKTPYGFVMLAPAYSTMHEDIGRVTQKFPGTSENGSVYNHAAAFYGYSLYQLGRADDAFEVLSQIVPRQEMQIRQGQLAAFMPNYYRGAYDQYPETAGRSSQLFNTGTVAWFLRCLIEGLFGLKGSNGALSISPNLPSHWPHARVVREFAGARFEVIYKRVEGCAKVAVYVDGMKQTDHKITDITPGETYKVRVSLPCEEALNED